jgi:hypothetical protein
MAKSKEQKRKEAQERALLNMSQRTAELIRWTAVHHMDLRSSNDGNTWSEWTVKQLRTAVAGFYVHLRDCGLPHEVGAFYILHDKVLIAQDADRTYRRQERKCLYCLQHLGKYHKAPCAHSQGGRVADHEALYIDEGK